MIGLAFVAGIAMWFFIGYLMGAWAAGAGWPLAMFAMAVASITFLYAVHRIGEL